MRYRRLEVRTGEYAMVNDRCHNYVMMLYYTMPLNMRKQLRDTGFTAELAIFGINGQPVANENIIDDTRFYVIRKS